MATAVRFLSVVASALCVLNAVSFIGLGLFGGWFGGADPNTFRVYMVQNAISLAIVIVGVGTFSSRSRLWPVILVALAVLQVPFDGLWLLTSWAIEKYVGFDPWGRFVRVSLAAYLLSIVLLAFAILPRHSAIMESA